MKRPLILAEIVFGSLSHFACAAEDPNGTYTVTCKDGSIEDAGSDAAKDAAKDVEIDN